MIHIRPTISVILPLLLAACLLSNLSAAEEFEHEYRGNTPPAEADPPLVESRKSGGGQVTTDAGKLRVEVPEGANHFYTIEGPDFNGASEEGTTLDFSLTLQGADPEQAIFSIRVGTGKLNWHVMFYPDQIRIGSQEIVHDTTKPDVYRISFQDGTMSLFSARSGELAAQVRPETRWSDDRISFGTRNSIKVNSPVGWELSFLRWTNKRAIFSPPAVPTAN